MITLFVLAQIKYIYVFIFTDTAKFLVAIEEVVHNGMWSVIIADNKDNKASSQRNAYLSSGVNIFLLNND